MGFLENLVKVFPNLASRPLYLTGESYAGTYIVSVALLHIQADSCNVTSALHHQDLLRDG